MASFAEREQGSSQVHWGNAIGRTMAGIGAATGVILVGAGLGVPILSEVYEGAEQAAESLMESGAEEAVKETAKAAGEKATLESATPNELTDTLKDLVVETTDLKDTITTITGELSVMTDELSGHTPIVAETAIEETIKTAAEKTVVETVEKVTEDTTKTAADALTKKAPTSALVTGALLGAGSLAYLKTHPAQQAGQTQGISPARLQNAQMGFAAKEQMRAVNSLMEARMATFGQGAAPQGPAMA